MFLKILIAVVVVYCLLALLAFAFQPRMVFLPDLQGRSLDVSPQRIGLAYEEVSIRTEDGETLHGWWLPHPDARGTLLFSHGNAGNISHRLESLQIFHQLGLNVLIYDYRGYGQSTGKPGEPGVYRDVDAAWRWLVEARGEPPERIVVFGRSLGGAVTARLAAHVKPACVILESSFTSVPDLGADLYWWLPVQWLSRIQLDTRSYISDIDQPLLIIHSRDDEIVPYEHARNLLEAATEPKKLLTISGGHNTGFIESKEVYLQGLDEFLGRCLGGDKSGKAFHVATSDTPAP